jgi:pimeloyl-ACP methyl ester carboxylesterase
MQDFSDDFLRVLDSLKLDRVIGVGHSMGGRILMEVCALNPDRLAGLVLSGSQASYLAHLDDAQRQEYVSSRETMFVNGKVSTKMAYRVAQQVLPAEAEAAVVERLVVDFMRLNRQGYFDALRASAGWDRSDILSKLKIPVAVLGGALDTVCPPSECARIADFVGQGPAVILDGIGHMAQIEAPQLVTKYLDDFISAHAHLPSSIDTQVLFGETQ